MFSERVVGEGYTEEEVCQGDALGCMEGEYMREDLTDDMVVYDEVISWRK